MIKTLFVVILTLSVAPLFGQVKKSNDSNDLKIELNTPIIRDSIFYNDFFEKKDLLKPTTESLTTQRKEIAHTYKMPILTPNVISRMPIHKPDSSFKSRMPIKRY